VAIDDVEAAFRARMKALARKGGDVTKQRHGCDTRYYRDIGRLGGSASVAARKARIAAELEVAEPDEAPIVEPLAPLAEVAPAQPRAHVTLKDILADIEREGTCVPDTRNRRQSLADLQAERDFARFIAQIQNDSDDDEPWDPWG
jgi:general stress protein YciG